MDIVFCTANDTQYTAHQFAQLPVREIEELRTQLICDECRNPAFFRRRTRDGRAPCFGGRPHKADCSLATADAGAWGVDGSDSEAQRVNDGDRIIVDLRLDVGGDLNAPGGDAGQRRQGRGRTFVAEGGAQRAHSYRRLRPILRNLMRSEAFRESDQIVEIPGTISLEAKDLFVNFDDIEYHHIGKFRGYWGSLSGAREAGGTVWLNTGAPVRPSIPISEERLDDLLEIARVDDVELLAGAYVLVFGKVHQSDWKKYITFDDMTRIAVIARE